MIKNKFERCDSMKNLVNKLLGIKSEIMEVRNELIKEDLDSVFEE